MSAADGITVTGPKGSLSQFNLPGISLDIQDGSIEVKRAGDEASTRAKHGLMRALLNNMVTGVSKGFERKLELNGVGYRVNAQGQELKFALGFSHEVIYKLPESVTAAVEQNVITIAGTDKQQVGQVAAEIRALKKPEPYKGKGIKYLEERIIRKSGKSGKEAAA
jgi:large subunit ribosomal protein L6